MLSKEEFRKKATYRWARHRYRSHCLWNKGSWWRNNEWNAITISKDWLIKS